MSLTNSDITAKNFKEFYERLFPYLGGCSPSNSESEKDYEIYCYVIDDNDPDPETRVQPYYSQYGCDNYWYKPAYMDFKNDTFEMGGWTGEEFFFPKPCVLKFNGEVDYYLDKDDYSKKIDGTASSITDTSINGNVMVEFPKIYFKRWQSDNKSYVLISNKKLDNGFKCYAHLDKNGDELDYIYMSAYNSMYDGSKMRSLSRKSAHNKNVLTSGYLLSNTNATQEQSFAVANNDSIGSNHEGYTMWHKADWDMVLDLLFLMSMSTDLQTSFGRGRDTGYVNETNTGQTPSGNMDDKGIFYGKNDGTLGVKVFGIENFWGNIWTRILGYINDRGTQKVKMSYDQSDGSTADGFDFSATGFISIANATPSGTSGGYISKYYKTKYGFVPYQSSGSNTTFVPDVMWFNNGQVSLAVVGGSSSAGLLGGAAVVVNVAASDALWGRASRLSYK